jgi:hypothetical protein
MKTKLLLALSFCFISLNAARADALAERVVLEVTGNYCPNNSAREVRAVPLMADGKPVPNSYSNYLVPMGYALEITDLDFSLGWQKSMSMNQLSIYAMNRSSHAMSLLYSYRFAPSNSRKVEANGWQLASSASEGVASTGTVHVPFVSGLLFTSEARVCVLLPDVQILEAGAPVILRGRLHKLDGGGRSKFDDLAGVDAMMTN